MIDFQHRLIDIDTTDAAELGVIATYLLPVQAEGFLTRFSISRTDGGVTGTDRAFLWQNMDLASIPGVHVPFDELYSHGFSSSSSQPDTSTVFDPAVDFILPPISLASANEYSFVASGTNFVLSGSMRLPYRIRGEPLLGAPRRYLVLGLQSLALPGPRGYAVAWRTVRDDAWRY